MIRAMAPLPLFMAALVLLAAGCSRPDRPFRVSRCDPGADAEVSLNQDLWITFSRYPDPATVNEQTVRVLDAAGRPVPGRRRVVGKLVVFHPRLPLQRGLDDGGFRPGGTYTVEVPGFPRLNTVRCRGGGGRSLEGTFRCRFRVTPSDRSGAVTLLSDLESPRQGAWPVILQGAPGPTGLMAVRVAPGRNPRLVFSEPLDPRSLAVQGPFQLSTLVENRPIPLDEVRLVAKGVAASDRGRVVELVPSVPLRPGGEYRLQLRPGPWLQDYAGNRMDLGPRHPDQPLWLLLEVQPRLGEEFFTQAADCDPTTAPGEAWGWWGEGQLSVALLPEAGSAALGYMMPTGTLSLAPGEPSRVEGRAPLPTPADRDLHFSRLVIGPDAHLVLRGPGPWILRSQGPVDIQGHIEVVGVGRGAAPPPQGTWVTPRWLLQDRRDRSDLVIISSGNINLAGRITLPGGGVTLASGGRVLVGAGAQVEAAWLERADRRLQGRRFPPGCHLVCTGLTPSRKRSGWVSEPLEVGAISLFRELPGGPGVLAQPIVNAVGAPGLRVHLQGAPADPLEPDRPDRSRLTPWLPRTDMHNLRDCRWFRFRIRFTVPAGREVTVPKVTAFLLRRE